MNEAIKNRYEFVYLFDVENGNPNGDPDAGNMPRIDPETSYGIVTDVCIKRKIRNYVDILNDNTPPYEIHVREGNFLSENHKRAHLAIENETVCKKVPVDILSELENYPLYPEGICFNKQDGHAFLSLALSKLEDAEKKVKKLKSDKNLSEASLGIIKSLFIDSKDKRAKKWMCKNFFDIRTFGAVMSTGDMTCGQVRGPVQLTFAKSIDSILPTDISLSRTAPVSIDKPHDKGLGARKAIVPYGLYRVEGYISANLAQQTGFGEEDLELLWNALINMFDHDHSAARGKMCARKLVVFKHDSELGNAPAHKLFETVKIKPCEDKPARSFSDYEPGITIPSDGELADYPGVTVINKL